MSPEMTTLEIGIARSGLNVATDSLRDNFIGMKPLVSANVANDAEPSTEIFTLKLLPDSDVPMQLSRLFPDKPLHLEALGEALSADRARSFLSRSIRGDKESFLLSTPRLRMSFFEDRFDAHTVIVKFVEENTFYRWENERKHGAPCNVVWTTRMSQAKTTTSKTLGRTRKIGSKSAPEGFWEFWGSLLAKEREALQALVDLPGWAYSKRRRGTSGGIEFKVGDYRDDILQKCGNTFLVECADAEGRRNSDERVNKGARKFLLFDTRHSEASEWIAAESRKVVDLSSIPTDGNIRIDWIGVKAELKRRQEALDRLCAGKSAQPGLAEMLPNGPTISQPLTSFTKILSTPYNAEQVDAVSKALAPGSITSILGPPGTGKTSVIAEIAAQLASAGKRVLISAQSNLAVDNALERVTEVESIFAVRIGRPESVKLNPELLLDRASSRYRDRLLIGSARAEEIMTQEVKEELQDLPSEAVLNNWIDESINYSRLQAALINAQETNQMLQEANIGAASALHVAEACVIRVCNKNSLVVADAGHFIQVAHDLKAAGLDPDAVHNKREIITFAHSNSAVIAKIANKSSSLTQIETAKAAADEAIKRNQGYTFDWNKKVVFLSIARTANANHEREKASAGFFKSLWLGITGPPHDLAALAQKLEEAGALHLNATMILPSLLIKQNDLSDSQATTTKQCLALIQGILDRCPLAAEITTLVKNWNVDIELTKKVVSVGALPYLSILDHFVEVESAFYLLKKATCAAQLSKDSAQQSERAMLAVTKDLRAARDPQRELAAVAKLVHMSQPSTIIQGSTSSGLTATDMHQTPEFFSAMRARRGQIAARGERWPDILQALDHYRARLIQPVVDLQRAVLSEANVIGATCSGIAGTRDFDSDFDCVIVDEAGRTTPLDLLMPIVRGKSIVLVGDHKQLPPFIGEPLKEQLTDIERHLVERSIFETIYESSHPNRRQALRKQYRMAPAICDIVKEISYKNDPSLALETAGEALHRKHTIPGMSVIHWVLPSGPKNIAVSPRGKFGLVNQAEVEAAVDIFKRIAVCKSEPTADPYTIGIISMYKQQSQAIERKVSSIRKIYPTVHVETGTVDSFQGREKDAIILSFSGTDPKYKSFFYDRRRLNVALSRAKELLVIICNLDKLGGSRTAFGVENPLFELRFLIESGIGVCASKEIFNA